MRITLKLAYKLKSWYPSNVQLNLAVADISEYIVDTCNDGYNLNFESLFDTSVNTELDTIHFTYVAKKKDPIRFFLYREEE